MFVLSGMQTTHQGPSTVLREAGTWLRESFTWSLLAGVRTLRPSKSNWTPDFRAVTEGQAGVGAEQKWRNAF